MPRTWKPTLLQLDLGDGRIALALMLSCVFATALGAAEPPQAVSPGHDTRHGLIEARCPTFSWGAVPGAESYELVVYRIDGADSEPELRIEERLPGSATTWTPALKSCFPRGARYAWSVRAVDADQSSGWSPPKFFQVAGGSGAVQPEVVPDGPAQELPGGDGSSRDGRSAPAEFSDDDAEGSARDSSDRKVSSKATGDPLLNVSGGIAGTTVEATGAITSAGSLSLDGSTDTITASSGTLSFADENLTTTGATTTAGLTLSGLDCSGNANGGALTASASGVVSCSDDETGQIAADSLDFDDLADALTADATTTVDLDTNAADLDLDANTLFLDSSENRVGIGTATPAVALDVVGDVAATGTITADGGIDFGMASLDQTPSDPVLVGSLGIGDDPRSVSVSGRSVYVVDQTSDDLKVIDVSDPNDPTLVGSLGIGSRPWSVFVSGRYAYVTDIDSDDLKVIDVSKPNSPTLVGSLAIGSFPSSVFVSGRYAYVVDAASDDLKVIDVSEPSAPSLAGSVGIGTQPLSVFVSGRYAYVIDNISQDLKVIDVSDPGTPTLVGSLGVGFSAQSVFVSGRYAYVADESSNDLKVIDVSDPSGPTLAGSLGNLGSPRSVFVSGRYAYVADGTLDALLVIDVSDPNSPALAGSLGIGPSPFRVYVSGRYAYVTDPNADDLKVIDVSGAEFSSAIAHSLEAGSLQVRESLIVQGQLQVSSGATIGSGGLFSDGNVGVSGTVAISNDVVPTSSPANLVQLYAEDDSGSSELKVRDEAGNVTTLSPHNFSLVGEPSEPLAWSFYSENDAHGRINVDMLRAVRVVEQLAGEKLVHTRAADGSWIGSPVELEATLQARVEALRRVNRELRAELSEAEAKYEAELARIRDELGLE